MPSPESLSPTSAPKRKKTQLDDNDGDDPAKKKQRTRVSFSCGECHRRKQKCDRQFPCSHCVSRKVPHKCIPYTPGKGTDPTDVGLRLTRLEQIIEQALPQYAQTPFAYENGSGSIERPMSTSPDIDQIESSKAVPIDKSGEDQKWSAESTPGPSGAAPMLSQLSSSNLPGTFELASPTDKLRSLIEECGVPPHKLSEIANELPPEHLSDTLIQYYFKFINYTRYPIYEPEFRASYASIRQNWPRVVATDVGFLPLLFVVIALAVRLAPERIAGDPRERKLTSLRYYWSSRRSMIIAAAVQSDSFNLVLAQLLSARFLIFERRLTECWSQLGAAVKTAQALDLHRDPGNLSLDPFQAEYRRRIWSYLYHADRTYSLLLGRPYALQDEYSSTLAPSNIEESTFHPTLSAVQPLPLSTPTQSTYLILRHKLANLMGFVIHHFQQMRFPSRYSEVLTLDEEITKFSNSLPPHFAADPDTSLDESHDYIPIHRFIILTEILFVRIALHRPYVLRRLESERYNPSRRACFDSAVLDFQLRQAFRQTVPRDAIASLGWAYREFQSAMMCGIALTIDPQNSNASIMHTILNTFLQDREGLSDMDPTTRREIRIVQFLKTSAASPMSSAVSKSGLDPELEVKHHAGLLLGLQHSMNGNSSGSASAPPPGRRNILGSLFDTASAPGIQSRSMPSSPSILSHTGARSPTLHLSRDGGNSNHTGSPIEDESDAQKALDRWCSTMGGDSTGQFWDPVLTQWPLGGQDAFAGFISQPSYALDESLVPPDVEGGDGTFWENLVSQIRDGGVKVSDG